MADTQFSPHPAENSGKGWSLFSWKPTSITLAQEAEHKLLSRFQYFKPAFMGTQASQGKEGAQEIMGKSIETLNGVSADPVLNADGAPHGHEEEAAKAASEPLIARVGLVKIGEGKLINTLVIDRTEDRFSSRTTGHELLTRESSGVDSIGLKGGKKKTLVMCHGYGAGLGFFYRNFAGLSELPNWRIYAIDWLGMANSSRPPFPSVPRGAPDTQVVSDAEQFFVDSLEEWRVANHIDKMTLMGHSLGGYLATAYATKFPDRVEKLVLVSPAGVGVKPDDAEDFRKRGWFATLAVNLWEWNVTPMSLIRTMGPWGPSLVRKYTNRRFSYLDQEDSNDLHGYIYHISAQPGSGEFALARLLLPGAWARQPLHNRLLKLPMPVTFLYGDIDWMDYRMALTAASKMTVPTRVGRVKDAGHHLYLDNPLGFNRALLNEMEDVKVDVGTKGDVEYLFVR
ncbi:Alpha/Beta hydrolase protein [Phlyctochytrium arcticum]|nr:Alpha/Beta hydrolase protein [Phlyctochytrium arcticum]